MQNLGLKLWSINADAYFEEAKKLYENKYFDFIELYVVPETLDKLNKWVELKDSCGIPFNLHAPHFAHNTNLAKKEYEKVNIKTYNEVKEFAKRLKPSYIVVHGGMDGDVKETVRQLKNIELDKMIIENKPYIAPLGERKLCRGASVEEISMIMNEIGCGFCLDVSHAVCAANSFKIDPYEYLKEFNNLNPVCYHLCDGQIESKVDLHLNFGKGNYDLNKIFSIIDERKNIAIETRKSSKENLNDFEKDIIYLRNIRKDLS